MAQTHSTRVSVLEEILKWSETRPPWQRDALRRILVSGSLSAKEVLEVEAICRAVHGATDAKEIVPEAIAPKSVEIAMPSRGAGPICLRAVKNPHNVNHLPGSETLDLGSAPGLAVVYGNNGSGKSGYARIVKAACRARGTKALIRSNAFAASDGKPSQATICFAVGGVEKAAQWVQGADQIEELGGIYVFDSQTAVTHAGSDNAVEFTPLGLDILPELARVCDEVKKNLEGRQALLQAQRPIWTIAPPIDQRTSIFKFVRSLSALTGEAEVERLAMFDLKDQERLTTVTATLADDPVKRAATLKAASARLTVLREDLTSLADSLSDATADRVAADITNAAASSQAAAIAASRRFDESFLRGTGSAVWIRLWNAARAFSVEAFPNVPFPTTSDGSKCLLCQQDVSEDAASRLVAFEAFIQDKTQEDAKESARLLEQSRRDLSQTRLRLRPDRKAAAELQDLSTGVRAGIRQFLGGSARRLRSLRSAARRATWSTPSPLNELDLDPLAAAIASLETQARDAERSVDGEQRAKLELEKAELEARRWMTTVKDECLNAITRERAIEKLQRAALDGQTNQITTKNRELAEQAITPVICDRFAEEIKELKLSTIQVELVPTATQKGKRLFKCMIRGVQKVGAADVASEGEHRCVAIAAFLAELATAPDASSVVLDDPVSSLDHMRRKEVAARLAEEAKKRQVVIFTHDLVFVEDLIDAAEKKQVPTTTRCIVRRGGQPGFVLDGLPWKAKSVPERIDALRKTCSTAAEEAKTSDDETAGRTRRGIYDQLRATIEIAIEKDCFAGTIMRFRDYINTKQLLEVSVLTEADCISLKALFDKASDAVTGHADAAGRNSPPPELPEILTDIGELERIVSEIRTRRKAAKQKSAATA